MNEPDVHAYYTSLLRRAELRGKMKLLEVQIKRRELPIRKQSPRKPELRDEVSLDLQEELANLYVALETVQADIDYYEFYKDVWKYQTYKEGKM